MAFRIGWLKKAREGGKKRKKGKKALRCFPKRKKLRFLEGSLGILVALTQYFLQLSQQPHERLRGAEG